MASVVFVSKAGCALRERLRSHSIPCISSYFPLTFNIRWQRKIHKRTERSLCSGTWLFISHFPIAPFFFSHHFPHIHTHTYFHFSLWLLSWTLFFYQTLRRWLVIALPQTLRPQSLSQRCVRSSTAKRSGAPPLQSSLAFFSLRTLGRQGKKREEKREETESFVSRFSASFSPMCSRYSRMLCKISRSSIRDC